MEDARAGAFDVLIAAPLTRPGGRARALQAAALCQRHDHWHQSISAWSRSAIMPATLGAVVNYIKSPLKLQ
jgi:hypothetical protein